jgi:hypothetical protein
MGFKGKQKTFKYKQINSGKPQDVFPLLCPVRERDWLDGWDCEIIYSNSGFAEKDCVFSTTSGGQETTIWHITQYDAEQYNIEFVRVTPGANVVKINIFLELRDDGNTDAFIHYQYTGLNEEQNKFIETELEDSFKLSMEWWETAINHYLESGEMLKISS